MTPTRIVSKLRLADLALLTGRLLLCLIFVHEGLVLATHFDGAAKAMAALGVGVPLLVATIVLQLAAGLSVGLGLLTRLGAALLGLFCLATAALFHTNFANQNELLHFQKDLAMAGGMFVLAVAGAGAISIDCFLNGLRRHRVGDVGPGEPPQNDRWQIVGWRYQPPILIGGGRMLIW